MSRIPSALFNWQGTFAHTVHPTEGQDLTLDILRTHIPLSLVDDELWSTMVASILISLGDYECRDITGTLRFTISLAYLQA